MTSKRNGIVSVQTSLWKPTRAFMREITVIVMNDKNRDQLDYGGVILRLSPPRGPTFAQEGIPIKIVRVDTNCGHVPPERLRWKNDNVFVEQRLLVPIGHMLFKSTLPLAQCESPFRSSHEERILTESQDISRKLRFHGLPGRKSTCVKALLPPRNVGDLAGCQRLILLSQNLIRSFQEFCHCIPSRV